MSPKARGKSQGRLWRSGPGKELATGAGVLTSAGCTWGGTGEGGDGSN